MTKQKNFGTFTENGDFKAVCNIQVSRIEYVSKSTSELKEILAEKIDLEQYEQCALIRDEIARR